MHVEEGGRGEGRGMRGKGRERERGEEGNGGESTLTGCPEPLFLTESNSFLLWATPSSIYMYALPSNLSNPKMTSVPQLLPIGRVGEVAGVTYDPRNESVVWLDGETNYLHR